ncbi:hypothetical protein [Shewanella phaeophyticola]|uniref:DUF4149 domain-containing protein n=1 Tax=Shewanella phaeophyticola TaxID=2978345 RepID=A0ABT2P5B1_9GAMM|nr:hypothetical protein [Shewanella sp. KJ10-1]MCT8987857.1 hypothetical protein [Shewanella sp. KJ10-1]
MAILISLWGVSICCFGLFMLFKPEAFSSAIVTFSHQRYFHYFEIISRLAIGAVLLLGADQTRYPLVFEFIGNLLFMVAILLVFMTEKHHKIFAVKAAKQGLAWFRPAGLAALLFGIWTIYVTLN